MTVVWKETVKTSRKNDYAIEDSGNAKILDFASVGEEDCGIWLKIISWCDCKHQAKRKEHHALLEKMAGKKLKISIEVVE